MINDLFHYFDENIFPLIVEEKICGEIFVIRTYKNTNSNLSKVFVIAINKRNLNIFSVRGDSYSDCLKRIHDSLLKNSEKS